MSLARSNIVQHGERQGIPMCLALFGRVKVNPKIEPEMLPTKPLLGLIASMHIKSPREQALQPS